MAYVVGFLSEDEERVLASRGWELEPSPRDLSHPIRPRIQAGSGWSGWTPACSKS